MGGPCCPDLSLNGICTLYCQQVFRATLGATACGQSGKVHPCFNGGPIYVSVIRDLCGNGQDMHRMRTRQQQFSLSLQVALLPGSGGLGFGRGVWLDRAVRAVWYAGLLGICCSMRACWLELAAKHTGVRWH